MNQLDELTALHRSVMSAALMISTNLLPARTFLTSVKQAEQREVFVDDETCPNAFNKDLHLVGSRLELSNIF